MFSTLVNNYSRNLDALRDFVETVSTVILKHRDDTRFTTGELFAPYVMAQRFDDTDSELDPIVAERLDKLVSSLKEKVRTNEASVQQIISEHNLPLKVENGEIKSNLTTVDAKRILGQSRKMKKAEDQVRILSDSALMTLVSIVEWALAELFHLYFENFTGAAGDSEPFFSLDQLKQFKDVDEARDALIDHRVDGLMRESFEYWIRYLRDKPKLGLGYLDASKDELREIFLRRNLVVHTGGIVNSIYLRDVPESVRKDLKVGEKVDVSREYLARAIDLLDYGFTLVISEMWKKLNPVDEKRATDLLAIGFAHLEAGRWECARYVSDFVVRDKGLSEDMRLRAQVNYWQSFKWEGRYEEIRSEIEGLDFSAKAPIFQLAQAALRDDYDRCFELLPPLLDGRVLTRDSLETWPLFKNLCQQERCTQYLQIKAEKTKDTPSVTAADTAQIAN